MILHRRARATLPKRTIDHAQSEPVGLSNGNPSRKRGRHPGGRDGRRTFGTVPPCATKHTTFQGKRIDYIEVERDDIATANMIASAVLGSCIDELPTPTRRLLRQTFEHVDAIAERTDQPISDIRFARRELRDELSWGQTQLKAHLDRLAAYEYVHVYPGPGRTLLYELRWDGRDRDGERTLFGLTDPSTLKEPPPPTTNASSASND